MTDNNANKTPARDFEKELAETEKKLAETEGRLKDAIEKLEKTKNSPVHPSDISRVSDNSSLVDNALIDKVKHCFLHGKSLRAVKETLNLKDADIARLASMDAHLKSVLDERFSGWNTGKK
ncbi:MAG: hypothetical protein LBO78_02015 [Rickettsiales bacterium]|jgi:hypothetical protein|nr:hypothetical protein [Rickettsiales bacterium]